MKFWGKCEEGSFSSAEFHSSGKLLLGTSNGKIWVYSTDIPALNDAELKKPRKPDYSPIRIGGESQAVTKILAFLYIEESPLFLIVVDEKELYLFNEKT